jgi:hypothetical protein
MYGYGKKKGDGLLLVLWPRSGSGYWDIQARDTNDYFLSGTFTVGTPTIHTLKDFETDHTRWHGTLVLPKMKISVKKP